LYFRDLEAPRHQILEDTRRIVLHRCCFHLCYILLSIACEWVLRIVCIVQVQVRHISFNTLSICADPADEICASLLEELILLDTLPVDIRLVDYGRILAFDLKIDTSSLTTQDLSIEALETEHVTTPRGAVLPVCRRQWLVKCVHPPVSSGLNFEVREHIHVDLVCLHQHPQVILPCKGTEVHADSLSAIMLLPFEYQLACEL
jgi:hypothetical protein